MAWNDLQSPFTHDVWSDARAAVGVIAGVARLLNSKRPRRKPPEGFDAAIDAAIDAAFLYAGVTKLSQTGTEGENIAVAYEKAGDAHRDIVKYVDDQFKECHRFWSGWAKDKDTGELREDKATPVQRIARLGFWATKLTTKAASNPNFDAIYFDVKEAVEGFTIEAEKNGLTRDTCVDIERSWRFVAFTGRIPGPGDETLFDAFSAALEAGEIDFARKMVQGDWEA